MLKEMRARRVEADQSSRRKEKGRPIFWTIFAYMMVVLVVEMVLLVLSLTVTNVSGRLDQNAIDLLAMQVHNRATYLQDMMQKAQDLADLSDDINDTVQQMLDEGTLTLDDLNSINSASDDLLVSIAPELVTTMRSKQVTGIFVVLNTQDLRSKEVGVDMAGVYLRDLDPDARASEENSDLLIERGSASVVKRLGITTDKSWKPVLRYRGLKGNGFFKAPFQTAYEDGAQLDADDYGRWTTSTYRMVEDDRSAIAYSQPLILPDGTVYGVVGVEILTSYLEEKLPYTELQNEGTGTYFLVSTTSAKDDDVLKMTKSVTSSNDVYALEGPAATMDCTNTDGDYTLTLHREEYRTVLEPITLYNRNAPFSSEQWVLMGAVRTRVLFAFAYNVQHVLALCMVATLVLGVLCSLLVSRTVAHPTEKLYREVIRAQEEKCVPKLTHTGIRELDRLAEALMNLNQELIDNSTKFLRIMDMASVELGGYELRYDTGSVYVTDNFFPLLGASNNSGSYLSVRRFEEKLRSIQMINPCTLTAEGDKLLTIRKDGETRYVLLRVTNDSRHVQVGLAEDVTVTTLERMRIEHERDYDILTGLYNRQAFQRVCEELFSDRSQLGVAALLMMDLDNLKHINDTYGHDWGDQYIHRTGRCLAENTPTGTVVARLSGDEFMLLFYGYHSREQVKQRIDALSNAMQKSVAVLPSGNELHISISGGIAWYPDDATDMETLKKYADFALYRVKRTNKGRLEEFSLDIYKSEAQAAQLRRDFQQLLTEERVYYVFQPIFSATTGRPVAYEALMRSDIPSLRSPATIMKLAREQGALYEIERLTFAKSLETFQGLLDEGLASSEAMLFINSIASVCLRREDSEYMNSRWSDLRRRMVIEITEEEEMNLDALEVKRHAPGFSGMFALDDYGSGYSNEGSLLNLAPRFIKIDIAIIRGIDTDTDKQQIMKNIVAYAHPRSMKIIAEGVENAAEMATVIRLGADALQGFYLAKPAAIPAKIEPAARQVIAECSSQRRDADEYSGTDGTAG